MTYSEFGAWSYVLHPNYVHLHKRYRHMAIRNSEMHYCHTRIHAPHILRHLFLFLTSLAWRCENLFTHQSSPSQSHFPHHSYPTLVRSCYGFDIFKDDYMLLLLAANLRMDLALRLRPVSSVAFVYLGHTPQLDHSPGFCYLHLEQFVFCYFSFFFSVFCFVAWGGRGTYEGG
jgi:hypothetical protein